MPQKCGGGSDPAGGAYSAPHTLQLDLRGRLVAGKGKEGREGTREGKG